MCVNEDVELGMGEVICLVVGIVVGVVIGWKCKLIKWYKKL